MNKFYHSRNIKTACNFMYSADKILNNHNNLKMCFNSDVNILKHQIKINKYKRLNSFHTLTLLNKYNYVTKPKLLLEKKEKIESYNDKNNNLFITKIDSDNKSNYNTDYFSNNNNNNNNIINESHNIYKNKLYSNIKNLKFKSLSPQQNNNNYNINYLTLDNLKKPIKFNKRIFSTINSNRNKNFPNKGLNHFIESHKAIRINNIQTLAAKTTYKNLFEDRNFKIQETNIKIFTLNESKNYLNNFIKLMTKYLHYLHSIANEEKIKSNELFHYKIKLEKENLKKIQKIKINKELIDYYRKYKILLLKVKYKVNEIKNISNFELHKFGIHYEENNSNLTTHRSNYKNNSKNRISQINFIRRKTRKLSSVRSEYSKKSKKNVKEFNKEKKIFFGINFDYGKNTKNWNPPIFENVDEFLLKMKSLENKVFDLFNIFSDNKYNIKDYFIEKNNIQEILDKNIKQNEIRIENYKNILNVKKLTYKNLLEKYNNLINIDSNYKNFNEKIINKIKKILINLPINIEIQFNFVNFYHVINLSTEIVMIKGKKFNRIYLILKTLEKIIDFYFEKINNFKNDKNLSEKYYLINKEIENEKKLIKNNENKMKFILQRKILSEKVIEKSKKLIYLPKKKIDNFEFLMMKKKVRIEEERKRKLLEQKEDVEKKPENWILY